MHKEKLKELINPSHSALIVIDLQNDFCHSEGIKAKSGKDITLMQQAAFNTQKFLPKVRKRKVLVIFIRARHNNWTQRIKIFTALNRRKKHPKGYSIPVITGLLDSWS